MSDNEDSDEYSDDDEYDHDAEVAEHAASAALYFSRLCVKLRANNPSVLPRGPNQHFDIGAYVSDSSCAELAEALTQNTIIRRIMFYLEVHSELSAKAMAKYLSQNKSLLSVDLRRSRFGALGMPFVQDRLLPTFIEAIGQSTSIKDLNIKHLGLGPASESFENMLVRTQSLRYLKLDLDGCRLWEAEQTTAIASGFSKNTSLQKIELINWRREACLAPVLTALQDHPVLEILHVEGFLSLDGIDDLLSSKKSQLKELEIERFSGSVREQLVGFEYFMQAMGRNTSILKMTLFNVPLSHDNVQQLKAMLRRNTVLEDLNLSKCALGSTGLAEIAPVLYRNTSIKCLAVSYNGLDDLASANSMRELLRRNKTITRLNMDWNDFGGNVAAVRCIADGLRSNKTLQLLDISYCRLGDDDLVILAQSLGQEKRSLVDIDLSGNNITRSGLRALINNATALLSAVTCLNLSHNPRFGEGATLLAETLRLQTMPSLKYLSLDGCGISDDGFATLMSALEQNESLENVSLEENTFSARGLLSFGASLPNIEGLRQLHLSWTADYPSAMPALLEGFRKNTSLHEVNIDGFEPGEWSKELGFILYRNKFSRLIQDSDTDNRASLGLWPHALARVARRPDVLFHVLTSKAGLVRAKPKPGKASKKRKHDDSV
jgi:Ran GTPase-activating protein (RanGAP) involved in mRNA processing and transport